MRSIRQFTLPASQFALVISFALHLTAAAFFYTLDNDSEKNLMAMDAPPSPISIRHITLQQAIPSTIPEKADHQPESTPPSKQLARHIEKKPSNPPSIKTELNEDRANKIIHTKTAATKTIPVNTLTEIKKEQERPNTDIKEKIKPASEPKRIADKSTLEPKFTASPVETHLAPQPELKAAFQQIISPESSYYYELLSSIEKNKFYPLKAKKRGQEGEVVLEISILKDGKISRVKIIKSSGISTLDRAAFLAVNKIKQFKPFPLSLTLNSTTVQIPMQYKLI